MIQAWRTAMEGLIRQQFETKEYSALSEFLQKTVGTDSEQPPGRRIS